MLCLSLIGRPLVDIGSKTVFTHCNFMPLSRRNFDLSTMKDKEIRKVIIVYYHQLSFVSVSFFILPSLLSLCLLHSLSRSLSQRKPITSWSQHVQTGSIQEDTHTHTRGNDPSLGRTFVYLNTGIREIRIVSDP